MGLEIERKFLVANDQWRERVATSVRMEQGYIAETGTCSVRIRVAGEEATLNFKGLTIGRQRTEFEYPVPVDDARAMMEQFCGDRMISKIRHHVHVDNHLWEVDEFDGINEGLIVAEVELGAVDEAFTRPAWAGEEVTDDVRYYNIRLVDHPWPEWRDE